MAPRWPQVNIGPEHINEHATYLREACHQLQAADKGRANQIPWNVVQSYLASTIAFIGKVLQQPSVGEVLHRIQDAAKDIQTIQRDITNVKDSHRTGHDSTQSHKLQRGKFYNSIVSAGGGPGQRLHAATACADSTWHSQLQDHSTGHGIQRSRGGSQAEGPKRGPTLPEPSNQLDQATSTNRATGKQQHEVDQGGRRVPAEEWRHTDLCQHDGRSSLVLFVAGAVCVV